MSGEDREKRIEGLKSCCSEMLGLIGEDVEREGLVKTPERVARAILDTTAGYYEDPEAILRGAMFKEDYSQMVIVKVMSWIPRRGTPSDDMFVLLWSISTFSSRVI